MTDNTAITDGGPEETEPDQCFCPLGGVMDLLSRKYAIQVICVLHQQQPVRYGQIEDIFGSVSSSTLSWRLDELTDAGLLERTQHDEIPPRVEYALTAEGEELGERLTPLLQWVQSRDGPRPEMTQPTDA